MPEPTHFAEDISHWMTDALALHREGDLPRAEQLYRRVLEREPAHADALHFLGVLAAQAGHPGPALGLIERAIILDPTAAHYVVNRGNVLRQLGRLDEAVDAYLAALLISPTHVSAYVNLANGLRQLGRLDEAVNAARAAVRLQEDEAELHNLLGVILLDRGERDEAIGAFERAIALRAGFPDAVANLERARAGELPAGCDGEETASSGPVDTDVPSTAPLAAADAGVPNTAPPVAADTDVRSAAPPPPEAPLSPASARQSPVPPPPDPAIDFGGPAVPLILAETTAETSGAHATGVGATADSARLSAADHSARLFAMQRESHALKDVFDEHRHWNDLHAAALTRDAMPHFVDMDPNRRLRVGFVSPALSDPGFARLLEPFIEHRDRNAFELFCYAHGVPVDGAADAAGRACAEADEWYDIAALSNGELAQKIREHRVDVLIDLAGHAPGNRLLAFARRPAPVQVTWLGYPDTTGMTSIDYRLTDAVVDPPGHASGAFSTEAQLRLDDCFLCLRLREGELPAIEKNRRRRVVFGCITDDLAKASPAVIALWGRILTASPGSRLVLVSPGLDDETRLSAFRGMLRQRGVATDRVELVATAATQADRLALINKIDVTLDTHPFAGASATCDALSMGVPVVTLVGESRASRLSASVLTAAGFPNYVAKDADDYTSIAAGLAGDGVRPHEQRRDLRDWVGASVLCDERRFAKNVEDAIRRMWKQFCAR